MKNFIVYGLIAFVTGAIWTSASFAAATSTSFKCSTTTKYCSCDINVAGDCDAMKRTAKAGLSAHAVRSTASKYASAKWQSAIAIRGKPKKETTRGVGIKKSAKAEK